MKILRFSGANDESILARPWLSSTPPRKILAIRLQALGDTVITFPYLQSLKHSFPSTQIDFLTREEFQDLPLNLAMFHRVYALSGGRDAVRRLISALRLIPRLREEKYDVVIDLQRNRVTRTVRRALRPKSFSEFDRFSPTSAGERTRAAVENAGFRMSSEDTSRLELRDGQCGAQKLTSAGVKGSEPLIVLNPAGSFITRSWPTERYAAFALLWLRTVQHDARFVILGVDSIEEKARLLEKHLGEGLVNLVGKTSVSEAFNIIRRASFVLSEDSGLMHMAWVAGVPTLGLFGSSRSTWSRPLGKYSACLDSSDMECGECLSASCRYGDVRCLSRYAPEFVLAKAMQLVAARKTATS